MKVPTTEFAIETQKNIKINRAFLLSKGWILEQECPLFESFVHSKNECLVCSIGLYGEFSISELHWINRTPERYFTTLNAGLTESDYSTILSLLNIKEPNP